jgi:acyl-coenzyme A thioesterase PaaI-like protein
LAEARILKQGRVLVVGDVLIRSENAPEPVARASMTYSIPPG